MGDEDAVQAMFDRQVAAAVQPLEYNSAVRIAQGGFGIVYDLIDEFGGHAILKLHTIPKGNNAKVAARVEARGKHNIVLQNERNADRLAHANHWKYHRVVKITIDDEEHLGILGDKLEHGTLEQLLERTGPLPIQDFYTNATQIASAIAHMHGGGAKQRTTETGLVHLDIKPDNVMFLAPNHPVIIDYSNSEETNSDGVVTRSGVAMPSRRCLPPELAQYDSEFALPPNVVSMRTDVWMLGALFYEMLTGENYNTSKEPNFTATLRQHNVPRPLIKRIQHCLADNPQDRYADASILYKELQKAQHYKRRIRMGTVVGTLAAVAVLGIALSWHNIQLVAANRYVKQCIELVDTDPVAAEAACTNAIGWYEHHPQAYLHLGNALSEQGKYDGAAAAYQRAAELSGEERESPPMEPPVTQSSKPIKEAIITIEATEPTEIVYEAPTETITPLQILQQREEEPTPLDVIVSEQQADTGSPEPVVEGGFDFDAAVERAMYEVRTDKVPPAKVAKEAYRRGLEKGADGDLEQAVQAYKIAIEHGHKKIKTYRIVVEFYQTQEAWNQVEQFAEEAIELLDDGSKRKEKDLAEFLLIIAQAELNQGKCREAQSHYKLALEYKTNNPLKDELSPLIASCTK
jgi:tetratricopeptide (TPR) repeat protein